MDTGQIDATSVILEAIQTGGLVAALTLAVIAFARGWVYAKAIVDELRQQVKDLTAALTAANQGMERMADAWEQRNAMERERERDRLEWDRRNAQTGGK